MREYVAIVFDDAAVAHKALHDLWRLDDEEQLTVYGARVVARKPSGEFVVEADDSEPPRATAVGIALGALLGLAAGPAGAAMGAAGGAAVGAAVGGVTGLGIDMAHAHTNEQAVDEVGQVMHRDQHAVIADVDESDPTALDKRMRPLGGAVYRRKKSDVRDDKYDELDRALYPYEYDPVPAQTNRR